LAATAARSSNTSLLGVDRRLDGGAEAAHDLAGVALLQDAKYASSLLILPRKVDWARLPGPEKYRSTSREVSFHGTVP
jgi:hypothetical protein